MDFLRQMKEKKIAAAAAAALEKEKAPLNTQPQPKKKRSAPSSLLRTTAETSSFDAANDSDTSSAEVQDAVRPFVYAKKLDQRTTDTHIRKKARTAGLLNRAAAIHSAVLDDKAEVGTVAVRDFEFGASKAPIVVNKDAYTENINNNNNNNSLLHHAHRRQQQQQRAPFKEEIAAVAVETKLALEVRPGHANHVLAQEAVGAFETQKGRQADYTDAKDIKRIMAKKKADSDKAKKKNKWVDTLGDEVATHIAGDSVSQKNLAVRARIEARSASEHERREAARHTSRNDAALAQSMSASPHASGAADHHEVRLTGTGKTYSAQSTTPAPGTAQRERIEKNLNALEERNVVVSAETREAKLATSVPPALVVQGRAFDAEHSSGAVVHGDGSTVQTPIDFALAPLTEKSQTSSNLIHAAIERVYDKLQRSVKLFYDMYEVAAEDSEFRKHPAAYAKAFEQRVHAEIELMYAKGDDAKKKKANMRVFLKKLFVGLPPDERKQRLMQKLSGSAAAAAAAAEHDALVDTVLVGAAPIESNEADTQEAAKRSAVRWQVDAEREALERQVPDITEEELERQMSYDTRPEDHILLRLIREHPDNDVLYRSNDEAPITLQRESDTVVYDGHHNSVLPEANKLAATMLNSNSFIGTLQVEETRSLRTSRMRLDHLLEESAVRMLDADETAEIQTLRDAIHAGESAARQAHNAHIINKFGHPDAASAVEALFERNARALETVPRAYAAEFMREPAGEKYGERACANELSCICNVLSSSLRYAHDCDRTKGGFVGREFLLPSQLARYKTEGVRALPDVRQSCYLCHLYQVTWRFMQLKDMRNNGGERLEVLQRFKTVFDEPGEYSASACNLAAVLNHRCYGIVAPFPAFNARYYQYGLCRVTGEDGQDVMLRQIEEKQDMLFH